jgi:hypothetical protein
MLLHMERICDPEGHLGNPPFRPGKADLYEKDIVHERGPSGILYAGPGGKMIDFVREITILAGGLRKRAGDHNRPGFVAGIEDVRAIAARKGRPGGIRQFLLQRVRLQGRLFSSLLCEGEQHDHTDKYRGNTGDTQNNSCPFRYR